MLERVFDLSQITQVIRWLQASAAYLKPNKKYKLVIKEHNNKKRSLDANNFCWMLCREIGIARNMNPTDVYKINVRQGQEYVDNYHNVEDVPLAKKLWESRGIGWFLEPVDMGPKDGIIMSRAYYGSSLYDTAQMARLIDRLVQDAESLDIPVMSERERSLLLEDWDAQGNKG